MTHSTEHKHDSPRDLSPLAARLVLKRLRDDRGPLLGVIARFVRRITLTHL